MQLDRALLIYLGVIVLFFLIFLKIGIYPMSSAVLTLIIGQIFLIVMAPPQSLDPVRQDSSSALYVLIQIATPIIAIIYLFFMAFDDRKKDECRSLSASQGAHFSDILNIKI